MSNSKFKQHAYIYDITLWNVYGNTDNQEGRGATILLGSFSEPIAARQFSLKKGVYGCDADVKCETQEVIVPFKNSVEIWDEARIVLKTTKLNPIDVAARRAEILKKLTPEEQALLGVK